MTETSEQQNDCPHCGHRLSAGTTACPACDEICEPVEVAAGSASEWARARDSLKKRWVASTIAFWVSASVLAIVFVIEDRIDLILTSITLAMLLIGMWLKLRYQWHLRKEP